MECFVFIFFSALICLKKPLLLSHSDFGTKEMKRLRFFVSSKVYEFSIKLQTHYETIITSQIDTKKVANIQHNHTILKCLASACGRQCVTLRSAWYWAPGNPGNFPTLLALLAAHDETLRSHLGTPLMRSATYISFQSQNYLIEVIGEQVFQGTVDDACHYGRPVDFPQCGAHSTVHPVFWS